VTVRSLEIARSAGIVLSHTSLLPLINRTVHLNDALAPVYQAQYGPDEYFTSALRQLDLLDGICRTHLGRPLSELACIADFACHYGRLLRVLRVAAPKAKLLACDIDDTALEFCAQQFSAEAFRSAWSPQDDPRASGEVNLLVCISLVTHTRLNFFSDVLTLWRNMARPGGVIVFTFLGSHFIKSWQSGGMAHYGPATPDDIAQTAAAYARDGHAFHSYPTPYSGTEYGVGFLSEEIVKREIAKHRDLQLVELRAGPDNGFGQDVAIIQRRKTP